MASRMRILDREQLRDHLREVVFGAGRRPDRFGMEVELFGVEWEPGQGPPRPVRLGSRAEGGLKPMVEEFARRHGFLVRRPDGSLGGDESAIEQGHFTFEPGGQVEFSGAPENRPAAGYAAVASALELLSEHLRANGIELLRFGINPWHDLEQIGLQTRAPRYRLMDAHFARLSPFGRRMMRQTATTHVNIDYGAAELGWRRWQAAQYLAPMALATFAHSPILEGRSTGWRSYRGRVWRDVDPSRCGFPRAILEETQSDPADQFLDFALHASLFMIRLPEGWMAPSRPITFGEWVEQGHDGIWPEIADWEHHLTTLFPEVRPRGFLELRSADNPPAEFESVPLTWWSALLCDDAALGEVIDRLADTAGQLPERMVAAARLGLSAGTVAAQARELYLLAQAAIARFPAGFFTPRMVRRFEVYGDHFVRAHRTPADDLLDLFERRGGLDYEGLGDLRLRWCRLTGVESEETAGRGEPAEPD